VVTFNTPGAVSSAGYPDAEMTFLSDGSSRVLQLRVLSLIPNQTFSLVLNSNLVYFGQSGKFLGNYTIPVQKTWLNLNITLPPDATNAGLNLLSFVFSQVGSCPSSGPVGQCALLVNKLTIN